MLELSTTTWTSIGPSPLATTSPANSNFNVSGRITAVAAHPTDVNTIYIAAAGGGVWRTADGGTSWTPLTDTQVTLSMGALAVSKTNPLLVLAGTGEANNSLDSNFGRGILRSADGGNSWTMATGPGGVFNTNRMACSKIVIDPTNANVAYAAMSNAAANGVFAGGITGVYKTTDAGVTWANVTAANGKDSLFPWSDAAVDPNTTSTVYGAVGYLFGTANNGGYKSVDTGGTWNVLNAANAPVGASFGRISLAISKAGNPNVLYEAAEDNTATGAITQVRAIGQRRSQFHGPDRWHAQLRGQCGLVRARLLSSTRQPRPSSMRPDKRALTVFCAQSTAVRTGRVLATAARRILLRPTPIITEPSSMRMAGIWMAVDGGLYRLDNPTTPSWTDLNGNLSTIQFYGIGLHPTNANIVIGGSQDNGTELYTGNPIWLETDGGDGGFAKFSPTNGNRVYHQIPNGSFGTNFFRRSDNGGNTWVTKTATISGDVNVQNFYAPFTVDPSNGDRVLYGTNRVWETTTGGDAWTPISASRH